MAYLSQGHADLAYWSLMKAARLGQTSASLSIALASAAMRRRDMAAAERWWRDALAQDPQDADSLLSLGTAQYRQHKIIDAIASYRGALEIAPELPGARISLAIAYLAAECPSLALNEAEALLSRNPDQVDLRFVRASALIQLDRAPEAIADLTWLYSAKANPAEAALLECEVHRALGDYEAALILAAELCEAFPTRAAPLRCFREIFADFMQASPTARAEEFLTAVGLPVPATRLRADDAYDAPVHPIDVVLPVHDGLEHLQACLRSLDNHRTPALGRIILVDDGSSPATRRWMQDAARGRADLRVIRTGGTVGYARALARGLSASRTKRFVALNSDCVVSAGWLDRLNAAMPADGRVAMVGPLSNAAGWQNLGDIFDANGNYTDTPMPSTDMISLLQSRLAMVKVFGAPDSALIHGFCVLVDRRIYDALGGLDLDLFPFGYGEFQDLSLRALDAGFHLRIADDCYVGHARGGSIAGPRRVELSREARRKLYLRHSALRYLSAECMAAGNRQVAFVRRRCRAIETHCPGEPTEVSARARLTSHARRRVRFAGRRAAVFVTYAPDGRILPYTRHYLQRLKALGFAVVLVVNGRSDLLPSVDCLDLAAVVIARDNSGFDFGGWRDALTRFPSLWDAELLLFTNDSIIGPFASFEAVVERVATSPAPLFFLTESEFAERHFQSFFWGLKGEALRHPAVQSFMASIRDLTTKTHAIFQYEVFLRQVFEGLLGLRSLCLFPLSDLSGVDLDIRPTFNPTHHLWRELLRSGFPFLKGDFCRKNARGQAAAMWLRELQACGGDPELARLHVEALQLQRTGR
ncbi:glycosyltransferase [Rhodobacter sp. SY28-1]|uniref:glycosyltransferase n=1 Tax=Rhodobacter sp. SY28-1 TaxID=2562317 RepID=UPI0014855B1C|nr:glycosyltransferase [Rhodobacter sp. SY28-1]